MLVGHRGHDRSRRDHVAGDVPARRARGRRSASGRPGRPWRPRSWPGRPGRSCALADDTLTMRPKRAFIMPGVARRIVWNAPVRFVSITGRHCSSLMRTTRPSRVIPALLTRTVTGPNALSISPNAASTVGRMSRRRRAPRRPCRPRLRRRSAVSRAAPRRRTSNRTRRDDRRARARRPSRARCRATRR